MTFPVILVAKLQYDAHGHIQAHAETNKDRQIWHLLPYVSHLYFVFMQIKKWITFGEKLYTCLPKVFTSRPFLIKIF